MSPLGRQRTLEHGRRSLEAGISAIGQKRLFRPLTLSDSLMLVSWPLAFQALKDKWGATPGEIAIWIWNSALRAYWNRGDPNGPLVRFSFLEDARGDDYHSILATLSLIDAEVEAFTPQARYLTFEQLSKRWRRYFNSSDEVKAFIIAETGATTNNLSMDFPPLDPLDRRNRPIEQCLFNESHVNRRTEVYFGTECRFEVGGKIITEASFEICHRAYEMEVESPGQHRVHALNRARELTVPAALEVFKRDLGGDYPTNLELLAGLFHEHGLQILVQGIAPIPSTVFSALYAVMTLGFTPKTDPATGEAAEMPSVERLLVSGKLLATPLLSCKIPRESVCDALLSHGGVAGLRS
jgi:hypothetical protein